MGLEAPDRMVHLTFGSLVHAALGGYEHRRMCGLGHEEALGEVVDVALRATWNKELNRPWLSGSPEKNRMSFIRTVVWYEDYWEQARVESGEGGYRTLRLRDGTPAVELPFAFDSGHTASTGEQVMFIGKLDRLVTLNEKPFVLDTKTTKYDVASGFWTSGFTPDNQFSMYSLAGAVALDVDVEGVVLDGIQVGANFSKFSRTLVPRPRAVLEEWLWDSHYWLKQMDHCAQEGHWPQNDKACGLFGGCPFRDVCGAPEKQRDVWLKQGFTKKKITGPGEDIL